jgi:hypothetical protein
MRSSQVQDGGRAGSDAEQPRANYISQSTCLFKDHLLISADKTAMQGCDSNMLDCNMIGQECG